MLKPTFVQLLSIVTVAVVIGTFVGMNFALSDLSKIITNNDQAILQDQQFIKDTTNQSAVNTRLILEDLEQQANLLKKITVLEDQIAGLETEVTTLKAEIVDLKEQLIESRIIISEQRANITATK